MSQEGANLPRDVEGGHDGAASADGGTPAGAGPVTVKTAASNSSSSSVDKPASPAVTTHAGEANKSASPAAAIHAGESNNAGSKPASPAAVDAVESEAGEGKENVAGGEGGGDAGSGGARSSSVSTKEDSWSDDGGSGDVKDGPAAGVGGGSGGKGKSAMEAEAEHALHIWTERERRKKMKNMFSSLHALLPQLPDKADKATIVGEAVNYIRTLEGTLQRLEKLKLERMRMQQLGVGSNVAPVPSLKGHSVPAPKTREATLANMVQGWNTLHDATGMARSSASTATQVTVAVPSAPMLFQTWCGPNVVVSVAGNDAFINICAPRQCGQLIKALFMLEKHCIDVVTSSISVDQDRSMFSIQACINGASTHFSENMTAEDRYKLAVSEVLHWITK